MPPKTPPAKTKGTPEGIPPEQLPRPAGWGFPAKANKAHYFPQDSIRSLCERWIYTGVRDINDTNSPDDCAACRKLKDAPTPLPKAKIIPPVDNNTGDAK